MNVANQIGCHINSVCLISNIILVCARIVYISSNLANVFFLFNPVIIHKCI